MAVTVAPPASSPSLPASVPSVWQALKQHLSPVEERPCIVQGIEAAQHSTRAGTPYVVIHNPATSTYLRLDPREYDLLALMDGTRSIKSLVVAYYQRNGVLALPRVAGLVRLLRDNQFLVEPPVDAYAALRYVMRRRDAAGLLRSAARAFMRTEVTVDNLDATLGAWYRAWGHAFFHPWALLLGIVLGLLGPILFAFELVESRYDLLRIGDSYLLGTVLTVALVLVSLLIHELGHGLAVKHAGRSVNRGGIMFYYGLPAAYVDTSDVWMAPTRQRLLAAFAGPWTGLVLGGLCSLGAFLVPARNLTLGSFFFSCSFVLLATNLYNLNPLLELDGYYMLVDLMEKPLLRPRALAFVRGPLWRKLARRERLTSEEVFFALFGLGAALYGALTLVLAIGSWQRRLGPQLLDALLSDGPGRAVAIGIAVVLCATLLFALWTILRQVAHWLAVRVARLEQDTAARLHARALAALRAVPLWSEVPRNQLLDVARAMRLEHVPAGSEVVHQGQLGERFYVVDHGQFEVLIEGEPVNHLGRGDYFGERALLFDAPRAASVVAVEDAAVFALDKATFRRLIHDDLRTRSRLEQAMAYRADVADIRVLHDLSPAEVDLLLARLQPLDVPAGTVIMRQGERGDRFYLVRSGSLAVEHDGEPLATLRRGDAVGEIALILDVPRTATVRALEDTELLALDAADFHDLLANYCGRAPELRQLSYLRLEQQHPHTERV